jgi:hypothetical protein
VHLEVWDAPLRLYVHLYLVTSNDTMLKPMSIALTMAEGRAWGGARCHPSAVRRHPLGACTLYAMPAACCFRRRSFLMACRSQCLWPSIDWSSIRSTTELSSAQPSSWCAAALCPLSHVLLFAVLCMRVQSVSCIHHSCSVCRRSLTLPSSLPQAHDEQDECNVGDTVRVHSCRPLSKRKAFVITQILHRAKQFDAEAAAQAAAADAAAHQSSALGTPTFAASAITRP